MKKLINIQIMEAKNVICVWREDRGNKDLYFISGISSETALANYMIPKYIAVCTFSDGTAKAVGLTTLNNLNEMRDYHELCLYEQFCNVVDKSTAKAFVRDKIDTGIYDDEDTAKAGILADMEKAGVEITNNARVYLGGRIDNILDRDIKDCFSNHVRVINCLHSANIETLRDLVRHSKLKVLGIRNLGRKSFTEIVDYVESHGLEFGMNV